MACAAEGVFQGECVLIKTTQSIPFSKTKDQDSALLHGCMGRVAKISRTRERTTNVKFAGMPIPAGFSFWYFSMSRGTNVSGSCNLFNVQAVTALWVRFGFGIPSDIGYVYVS